MNTKKEFLRINPNGINSFDRIIYINLDHRNDRKKQILNEFNKVNVDESKIIRIKAVHNRFNGHIGCAKSHIKALELAKKMNLNNVVIFEDDFVFTSSPEQIHYIINKFLNDFAYTKWDVIQLSTVWKRLKKMKDIDYVKKVKKASTSSAYIVQSHFYDKLINNLKQSVVKMEKEMNKWSQKNPDKKKTWTKYALDQHWIKLQNKSDWFLFHPYLGKQGGKAKTSSIMGKIDAFFNINKPFINNIYI